MENKRIIKKTGLYFIGNLSSKLLSSILVPLYAFYISTGDLGQFDYSQTVMNIINPIIFICIWEAILRFILTGNDAKKEDKVLATSSVFTIFVSIVLGLGVIGYYVFFIKDTTYMFYVMGLFVSHGLSNIWQYYARALKKNKLYVISGVLSTAINFSLNILLICVLHMQLEALYISIIVANLFTVVLNESILHVLGKIHLENIDMPLLKEMIKFSSPLIINSIASWLITGLGRVMIGNMIGKEANGLYAFANKFSVIVNFIGTVLNMAVIEEAILIGKEKKFAESFSNNMQFIFTKFLTLVTIAIPAIMIFYEIIQSTEYYESRVFVPIMLLYSVVMTMASNMGAVFHAINKTKYISISTLTGAGLMVIFSFIFIKPMGVLAVILGQLLAASANLISRYVRARKTYWSKNTMEKYCYINNILYYSFHFMY